MVYIHFSMHLQNEWIHSYNVFWNKPSPSWHYHSDIWNCIYSSHSSVDDQILYIYRPVCPETWRFVQSQKFMSPERDRNFLGRTNLHVSQQTGQLIVYYTESYRSYNSWKSRLWKEVWQISAFHWRRVRRDTQSMYSDSTAILNTLSNAVRHDHETLRLEVDMKFCLPLTWLL